MYAVLVGDKGAYELFHERQAWTALGRLWQERTDAGPAISLDAQDYACAFLRQHGTRTARRYIKANVCKNTFR
jgi:hypothetical protein